MSALEIFRRQSASLSEGNVASARLVMKVLLHHRNRKRMNAWPRVELDLNKTIF